MSQALIDAIRILRIELGIANERVAAAAGLLPRDLDILDVIDRDSPCTPSYLATRTGLKAATLTGILTRLEAKGWIERRTDPNDGRSVQLTSTDRFNELRDLYRSGDETVRALALRFDQAERQTITTFLTQVSDAVRTASAALPTKGDA